MPSVGAAKLAASEADCLIDLTTSALVGEPPAVNKSKTYVVLSDLQIPFEDKSALNLALDFIDSIRPQGVVLAGDIGWVMGWLNALMAGPRTRCRLV